VKASGVLGGAGREPTVISPNQYKKRFRRAMSRYFVMVRGFGVWGLGFGVQGLGFRV